MDTATATATTTAPAWGNAGESGPTPGAVADLVAVHGDDLSDVLAGATDSRVVLRRGRVVAATEVHCHTALDKALAKAPTPSGRTP